MRAVSTCPAGVMGWSLGAPTQPSARTTQGSYFNRHGVLKFAPPGILRPNYVYKNGIWVQDGWLQEGASQNCLRCNITNMGAYGGFPESYLVTKSSIPNISPVDVPSDKQVMVGSVYILLTHPKTTADIIYIWWSGSGATAAWVDLTKRRVFDMHTNAPVPCEDVGMALHVWLKGGPDHSTIWNPCFIPQDGDAVMACFQNEPLTPDGKPTSWIPYGQTRDAD